MRDVYGVAAFRSRQQVLRFEAVLKTQGVPARVVTTPRDISMGCGLSVQFDLRDWKTVQSVYRQTPTGNLIGFYQVTLAPAQRPQITPLR